MVTVTMLATVVIPGVPKQIFATKITIDHHSVSGLGMTTKPPIRKMTQTPP